MLCCVSVTEDHHEDGRGARTSGKKSSAQSGTRVEEEQELRVLRLHGEQVQKGDHDFHLKHGTGTQGNWSERSTVSVILLVSNPNRTYRTRHFFFEDVWDVSH